MRILQFSILLFLAHHCNARYKTENTGLSLTSKNYGMIFHVEASENILDNHWEDIIKIVNMVKKEAKKNIKLGFKAEFIAVFSGCSKYETGESPKKVYLDEKIQQFKKQTKIGKIRQIYKFGKKTQDSYDALKMIWKLEVEQFKKVKKYERKLMMISFSDGMFRKIADKSKHKKKWIMAQARARFTAILAVGSTDFEDNETFKNRKSWYFMSGMGEWISSPFKLSFLTLLREEHSFITDGQIFPK